MHHVIALCEFVPPPLLPPRRVPDAVQWWRWGATCYARHLHDPAELTVLWSRTTILGVGPTPPPRPPLSRRAPWGNAAAAAVTWPTIANCSAARGKW